MYDFCVRCCLHKLSQSPFLTQLRHVANRALIGDRTIMKTLLLLVLSMVAITREATAQDAECVRERAAMVETIRTYGRSDARGLGQQGLSARVLEARGQT